nr:DNA internalization-related competence protein ComEC/Rec2 [Shewanella jiangmenensis]
MWPAIPPAPVGALLLLLALIVHRRAALLAGAMAGVGWVVLFTLMTFDYRQLPEGRDVWIRAEIITPVSVSGDWQSIDIRLVKPKLISWPAPQIRLDWRTNEQVVAGDVWELRLSRRSISAPLNDGGFNQQRYLLSRHIGLKARVLDARRISASGSLRQHIINNLRQSLLSERDEMAQASAQALPQASALLLALLSGEQRQISQETWQQLRATGTGHLMAISGLHLSVLALWLFGVSRYLLGLFSAPQSRRNLLLASLIALVGCLLYALLAGMGIPTRRAFVMLALVCLLSLSRRFASPWERLLYALIAVLLLDPLSPLAAGFWLSFGAIVIILLCIPEKETQTEGRWRRLKQQAWLLVRIQLALSLGMGVLQLILFGGISIHSLWINLLMVPWFSLVVIPLSLLCLLLFLLLNAAGIAAPWLFEPALLSLLPHEWLLGLSDSLPAAWVRLGDALAAALLFALPVLLFTFAGGRFLRLPRPHFPHVRYVQWLKVLALCLLLPLVAWRFGEDKSHWQVHALDVGQGLAVVVFQGDKTLVYDTGASFAGGYSYGERVLAPFLAAKGRARVDMLILSHEDNDHVGGAAALADALPITDIISDTKAALTLQARRHLACTAQSRPFGSLTLEVLPTIREADDAIASKPQANGNGSDIGHTIEADEARIGNNDSCVVRIADSRHSLLLTGDIEALAEAKLVQGRAMLDADILSAPHHGSKTSSSQAFIEAVSPRFTVFAAGFNNRYGFPKAEVVARYQGLGSKTLVTADSGQLSLYLGDEIEVKTFREQLAPFWYNKVFGVGDLPITE